MQEELDSQAALAGRQLKMKDDEHAAATAALRNSTETLERQVSKLEITIDHLKEDIAWWRGQSMGSLNTRAA